MAGPSVAVRILGDLTGWSKSVSGAAKDGESGASRIKGAFTTVLGQLNSSGVLGPFGQTLETAGNALDTLAKKTASTGEKLLAAGGAALGVGLGLSTLASGQQQAQQQLATAIDNTGGSWAQYSTQIAAAVKAEEKHGDTASETYQALQNLTQATHSPAEALKLLGEASDIAGSKHEDLATAASQLGKIYNGNTKLLKEFGITVTKTADPVKTLTSAQKAAAKADQQLAGAKEKLAAAQTKGTTTTTTSTAATERIRSAERALADATAVLAEKHKALTTAHNTATRAANAHTTAVTDLGASYTGSSKQLKEFGTSTGAVASAAGHVTTATSSYDAAARRVADARARLSDLEAAGTTVTHTAAGGAASLMDAQQKLSDAVANAADKHQALAAAQKGAAGAAKGHATAVADLGRVVKGQADAAVNTFTGRLHVLRAEVTDDVVAFAAKYAPAITAAGAAMSGLGAGLEIAKGSVKAFKDAEVAKKIADLAGAAATKVAAAAQWLFNAAMDANPIVLVVLAIAALVAAFVLAYTHVTWFRDGINDLWQFIQTAWDGILNIVKGVFDWLATNWPLVLGILTGPFGLMVEQIVTHWTTVLDFIKTIPGLIVNVFAGAANWLVEAGEDLVSGLLSGIGKIWADVTKFFGGVGSTIVGYFSTALTWLATAGNDVITGLSNGFGTAWTDITTFLGNIPGAIVGAFKDAGKWLVNAGKDVIKGLAKGILAAAKATIGKLPLGIGKGLVNDFAKVLGVHSPSTVFASMGADVVAGFVQGINGAAASATSAVGQMTASVSGASAAPSASTSAAVALAGPVVNMDHVTIASGVDLDLVAQKVSAALVAGRL